MSNNNQGDKPNRAEVIKNGNLNIESLGEVGNNFVPLVETEFKPTTTHTGTGLLLTSNLALLEIAGNLAQKYGSLEILEQRLIEAEKRVKELEEAAKIHFLYLSEEHKKQLDDELNERINKDDI